MIADFAGAQDAVGTDVDTLGGNDRAPIQACISSDMDSRVGMRRDQAVDFSMRPGVDVSVEDNSSRTGDPQPAVAEQPRAKGDARPRPIGERGRPTECPGRSESPVHVMPSQAA